MNEKRMKRIKWTTTLMDSIVAMVMIFSTIWAYQLSLLFEQVTNGSSDYITGVDSTSVVAGYQVIFGTFGFITSLFGYAIVMAWLFASIGLLVWFMIPSVHGWVCLVKMKDYLQLDLYMYLKLVKRDGIVKLVFNGIILFAAVYGLLAGETWSFLWGCIAYTIIVCSLEAFVLKSVKALGG